MGVANVVYVLSPFGRTNQKSAPKLLKISLPEDLDYTGIFDDIFERFTTSCELIEVQTTNMGSLFQLDYEIKLRKPDDEMKMVDEIRCRNGNLKISCGRMVTVKEVL